MSSQLLVVGGNGFLGKRICQEAVRNGFRVVSLSRSGRPPQGYNTSDKAWVDKVKWVSGDVFRPSTYADLLRETTHVVHSMGILLESENYKKKIQSNGLFGAMLQLVQTFGANPLDKKDSKFTYEWMNKKSAIMLASEFATMVQGAQDRSFTYISADAAFPFVPQEYITSKREAEAEILKYSKQYRPLIMRPGFMFDEQRYNADNDVRSYVHDALDILNCANKKILHNKSSMFNNAIRPAVSTQQVSRCIMKKIKDPESAGILSLEEIMRV